MTDSEAVDAFLDVVDCRREDVMTVPAGRLNADHAAYSSAPRRTEGVTLYFGKHKGKTLSEVPIDYLEWMSRELNDRKMRSMAGREVLRRRTE